MSTEYEGVPPRRNLALIRAIQSAGALAPLSADAYHGSA